MPPDTLELLRAMIRIDSVNPALAEGAAGETELARFVRRWGEARGFETHWLEDDPGRPSVLLIARGSDASAARSLLLNAHLDTVGVAGMDAPFEPRLEAHPDGERLYGRGALDMKAGLAAAMGALARAAGAGLRGDVALAAVADEEHASVGMTAALRALSGVGFRADAAVVTEPTDLRPHIAHRGFSVWEIATRGLASHTSQPERGVNAVAHMGRVLTEIARLDAELAARPPHPLLGRGSAQPITIAGGSTLFVTPDACTLRYERRTLPGEGEPQVEAELRRALVRAGDGAERFDAELRPLLSRPPFETPADAEIVGALAAAAERVTGVVPDPAGAPYWMDAALIAEAGIPTVVFGPSGSGMHAPDEWLHVPSLRTCEDVLAELIADLCA